MRTDAANVTIIGRVAGHPTVTATNGGERLSMRVVSTERRYDEGTGQWIDGDEFGVTVVGWRRVSSGVISHVRRGDPVVVIGRISTRRFEREGGAIDYYTDVKADVVALDVARMNGRFTRQDLPVAAPTTGTVGPGHSDDGPESVLGVSQDPLDDPFAPDRTDPDGLGDLTGSALADAARPLVPTG